MKEIYNNWCNAPQLDENLKAELKSMDEAQIRDAFLKPLEFGTAGMRGLIGAGINRINIPVVAKTTVGFAKYLINHKEDALNKGVAIAYDNRYMSQEFAFATAKILLEFGFKVYVFETLRPTPELSFILREKGCCGGVILTASHNPKTDNGYKVYDETGCQLIPSEIDKLINYIDEIQDELSVEIPSDELLKSDRLVLMGQKEDEIFIEEVLKLQINPQPNHTKVVFSALHGTSATVMPEIFKRAGYEVVYVEEQMIADPEFATCPSPNPEDKRAFELAIARANEVGANYVIATDPDADRMGVGVRVNDEFILLTGNQTGALLMDYMFDQMQKNGTLPANGVMIDTVVTSNLGKLVAAKYGVENISCLTGFKYIGQWMNHFEATKEKTYVFGYEESYGYLFSNLARDKDSIEASLICLEMINYLEGQNISLYDQLNNLYTQHGYFVESQVALSLKGEEGALRIKNILDYYRNNPLTSLDQLTVVGHEDYLLSTGQKDGKSYTIDLDKTNLIKYYFDNGSWLAIRPSGTEPKCKFYFSITEKTFEQAQALLQRCETELMNMVETI